MIDLLVTLAVLVITTAVASRYIGRFGSDERGLLWLGLLAHQIAGLGNLLVTEYYYQVGDMITYYRFGVEAADMLRTDFWGLAPSLFGLIMHRQDPIRIPLETLDGASGAMQGISSLMMYAFFDSLYGACAFIAALAFITKVALYKLIREELPHIPRRPLLSVVVLIPSVLFWSCSLLKEPLAMIGMLVALYAWHALIKRRNLLRSIVLLLLGSVTVIAIKGYIFPAMCVAIGAWQVARTIQDRRGDVAVKTGHVVLAATAALTLVIATGALLPRFSTEAITDQLAGLQNVGAQVEGGSTYALGRSAGSASAQAALAPLGLLTALFRPFLFEARSLIVLVGAFEMTGFCVASVIVLFRRGILGTFSALIRYPFLAFCAVFVVVFGTCVGLGTTNMGTLSRYRMPMLPFFGTLLLGLMVRVTASQREPIPSVSSELMSLTK